MTEKIIKWRSVEKDGLPKESCEVLISYPHGMMIVSYSDRYKCFNAHDSIPIDLVERTRATFSDVTHWAPISEISPEETDEVQI